MPNPVWDEITPLYNLPNLSHATIKQFEDLRLSQSSYTKGEGNPLHLCSFFLPYDRKAGKIYLGHHKKADDWIPPGGHLELGETPKGAAVREMQEELGVVITTDQLEPFNLSVKPINRLDKGCMAHYDVWHLVAIKEQDFDYLRSEYHDAGWFAIKDGVAKITKNHDFAAIIRQLIN